MKTIYSIITFLLFVPTLYAQDATLSVQGTVQKSSGAAIEDGNYEMTFKLYTSPTGGASEWSETQTGVEIVGGVYSALLGAEEPLNASFDQTYYLGVSVDGSAELQPRARLTSAPYALSLIGNGNIFPSSGPIGAGTPSPDAGVQLHIKNDDGEGKLLTEGSTSVTHELKAGPHTAILHLSDSGEMEISAPSNIAIKRGTETSLTLNENEIEINGDLEMAANKTIKYGANDDWRLVYVDDFEDGTHQGWECQEYYNNTTFKEAQIYTSDNKFMEGNYLGPKTAGNDALIKAYDLTGIPHTQVKAVFTYVFYNAWEGDEWAFAMFSENRNAQSGDFLIGFTRKHIVTNGFGYQGGPAERVVMTANLADDEFYLIISSNVQGVTSNESFWIDDVEIWVK